MVSIYNVPKEFLKDQGFPVYDAFDLLERAFDDYLNHSWPHMTIEDLSFTPAEVLYKLDRETYDSMRDRWTGEFTIVRGGGYLHHSYAQRARDCWNAEFFKKQPKSTIPEEF